MELPPSPPPSLDSDLSNAARVGHPDIFPEYPYEPRHEPRNPPLHHQHLDDTFPSSPLFGNSNDVDGNASENYTPHTFSFRGRHGSRRPDRLIEEYVYWYDRKETNADDEPPSTAPDTSRSPSPLSPPVRGPPPNMPPRAGRVCGVPADDMVPGCLSELPMPPFSAPFPGYLHNNVEMMADFDAGLTDTVLERQLFRERELHFQRHKLLAPFPMSVLQHDVKRRKGARAVEVIARRKAEDRGDRGARAAAPERDTKGAPEPNGSLFGQHMTRKEAEVEAERRRRFSAERIAAAREKEERYREEMMRRTAQDEVQAPREGLGRKDEVENIEGRARYTYGPTHGQYCEEVWKYTYYQF